IASWYSWAARRQFPCFWASRPCWKWRSADGGPGGGATVGVGPSVQASVPMTKSAAPVTHPIVVPRIVWSPRRPREAPPCRALSRAARPSLSHSLGGPFRGRGVAHELDVTGASDGSAVRRSVHAHRAFPVTDREVELLVMEKRRHDEIEAGDRHAEPPARRIARPPVWARPVVQNENLHRVPVERSRRAVGGNEGALTQRRRGSVSLPQTVEHELAAILEL